MWMKISFGILALSLVAILVSVLALLGRLRWHLRWSRSNDGSKNTLAEIEPAEKTNQN